MKRIVPCVLSLILSGPVNAATDDGSQSAAAVTDHQSQTPRPEYISCGLHFSGTSGAQGATEVLVENSEALVKGSANGVDYVFSVRGKTAVAKLIFKEKSQSFSAQGTIEMLRHGGDNKPAPMRMAEVMKQGDDDENDGQPEKEAGFDMAVTSGTEVVKLKCISINGVKP